MLPVAVWPPTVTLRVSVPSTNVSSKLAMVTLKLATPAGTLRLPPTRVTPLLKVMPV